MCSNVSTCKTCVKWFHMGHLPIMNDWHCAWSSSSDSSVSQFYTWLRTWIPIWEVRLVMTNVPWDKGQCDRARHDTHQNYSDQFLFQYQASKQQKNILTLELHLSCSSLEVKQYKWIVAGSFRVSLVIELGAQRNWEKLLQFHDN